MQLSNIAGDDMCKTMLNFTYRISLEQILQDKGIFQEVKTKISKGFNLNAPCSD